MADPLPPDPYEALGVGKDATAAAIKTQYRKAVLKFHPDKVKDDAAKVEASDKFHKIQSAWEILSDEARRARYDASVKLHELRKDVFAGHGGHGARRSGDADVRTASYKMPTESPRGGEFYARGPDRYGPKVSPQYEERRPSYASEEYFEEPPRPTSRKYEDYERTPKRAPPREDRERTRAKDARENERSSRKEKSRRTDKDVRRDRERKQAYVEVQEEYDMSDEYDRAQRTPPDDDHLQRAREDFFASREDPYARETAGNYDDRSRKTFQHMEEAKAHMERQRTANRPESASRNLSPGNRRPSPVRMSSSSKEKVKRTETRGGFFSGVRHGSGERPKSSRSKTEKEQKSSDEERKSSRRREETRDSKQPSLKQSKSTPPVTTETRPPFNRQRSHSMQDEPHVEEAIPTFKRAETMPQSPTAAAPPPRATRPRDNSRLHPDSASYPTPEATPEAEPVKFRYGKDQTYADDGAFIPTPDGYVDADADNYRTQEHVPNRETARQSTRESSRTARYTRSPEPIKDGERQGRRSSSARHTSSSQKPSMPRTTSTQYVVEPEGNSYVRPAPSRENSGREQMRTMSRENSGRGPALYGEVRPSGARSGSPRQHHTFPPPAEENVKYSRRYNDADVKVQTGYSRRQDERPAYTRSGSGLHRAQTAVYA